MNLAHAYVHGGADSLQSKHVIRRRRFSRRRDSRAARRAGIVGSGDAAADSGDNDPYDAGRCDNNVAADDGGEQHQRGNL